MILGDAGHGLILLVISIIVRKKFREREIVRNLATILLICSIYTVIFGLFYGEFLGELGYTLFGLRPLVIARHTSVIPMLLPCRSALCTWC
jgi:V/A-type H+-transporting ATPase subunit I